MGIPLTHPSNRAGTESPVTRSGTGSPATGTHPLALSPDHTARPARRPGRRKRHRCRSSPARSAGRWHTPAATLAGWGTSRNWLLLLRLDGALGSHVTRAVLDEPPVAAHGPA